MERSVGHNRCGLVGIYLFLGILLALPMSLAHSAEPARIMIYVELPATVEAATELDLGEILLSGPDGAIRLTTLETTLVSTELAGRQTLLVNAGIPAGSYTGLTLHIRGIRGTVGVAEVVAEPAPDGVAIPLELHAPGGEARVVFLSWEPRGIDPDQSHHQPDFGVLPSDLPPLGSLAFVTSAESGCVMLIDRLRARIVGAIRVDDDPRDMAYDRAQQFLYVALAGQDAIGVVDVMSLSLIKTVPIQLGDDPSRLLLSVDGSRLFVLSAASRTLTSFTSGSLQQESRVPLGEWPRSMAQDPRTGEIYVACEGEGLIQVVDPREGGVVRALSLVSSPGELVIDPIDRRLYVGSTVVRRIQFMDLAEEGRVGEQSVCGRVSGLAYQARSRRLFAGTPGCGSLSVLQPESDLEFAPLDLPGEAGLMAFDTEYRQLFVVLPQDGGVALCNPNRGTVETVLPVGRHPYAVLVP